MESCSRRANIRLLTSKLMLVPSRGRWLLGIILAVILGAVLWLSKGREEPGVYQVLYQRDAAKSTRMLEASSQQKSECGDDIADWCWPAGNRDEQLLHLARPFRAGKGPVASHGASVLSAVLSAVNGQRVASVLLTDPRDWMSEADNEELHNSAKEHLYNMEQGKSLLTCSFKAKADGDDAGHSSKPSKQTFGRAIMHKEHRLLVMLCPLPDAVACCVHKETLSRSGEGGSSPLCTLLKVTLDQPKEKGSKLPPITLFDHAVCQYGQFHHKLGVAVLVDPDSLAYFPQWMAYHQLLGLKLVVVYLLDGIDLSFAKKRLMPYLTDGSVIISAWNVSAGGQRSSTLAGKTPAGPWKVADGKADDLQSRMMMALYTDCLYRYRHSSDVMLMVDAHQYIVLRNSTGKPLVGANSDAPGPIEDVLPKEVDTSSSSVDLFTVNQAVFHPPIQPKKPETKSVEEMDSSAEQQRQQRKLMPMDLSSVMRCAVNSGVQSPRHAFRFDNLVMAWPGGGQTPSDSVARMSHWATVRLNAYHNRSSLPCQTTIMDMGMHTGVNWTLLDKVVEKLHKTHRIPRAIDL